MGNIIKFEDFSKRSKSVSEDTILPTGNSTVFLEPEKSGHGHDDHEGHEKNYMFFKNLYAMKKCIEDMMAMDKEQVDELLERGHDWASDHITSAKDDVQEVFDWLRYEIENYDSEDHEDHEDDEDDEDHDDITVDVEGDDDEVEIEDEDDEDDDEEEEEEASEGKGPNYSYKEEKK